MNQLCDCARQNPAFTVGLVLCTVLWWMSRDPLADSASQRAALASKYKFVRHDIPAVAGPKPRGIREVAPSLLRIKRWASALTSGVTIADLDGDGLPNDLLTCDNRTEQLILAPVPGSKARYEPFQLVAFGYDRETAGPSTSLVGDFNEDGLADVLVSFVGRTPLLYLRKPARPGATGLSAADYTVEEVVPLEKGKKREAWGTCTMTLADLDGDGRMDMMLGNYFPDWCDVYNVKETRPQEMHNNNGWANNGGGLHVFLGTKPTDAHPYHFREVKNLFADEVLHGWTLALGAQDLDGDMLPEVYMGNDLGPDRMFWNRSTPGHLKFDIVEGRKSIDTPASFVMGHDKYKGMSCDFFDLNFDGISDFFVSNVASKWGLQESHFLWMSRKGGPTFQDGVPPYVMDSERMGVSRGGWGWDAKFESFRNTVMPDLLQTRGFIQGKVNKWPEMQSLATYNSVYLKDPWRWPTFHDGADLAGHEVNAFYAWDTDGRYHDVGAEVGLEAMGSRGCATADVDGDGKVEFAIANSWNPPYFYSNATADVGHFLGLRLMLPLVKAGAAEPPLKVRAGRPPVQGRPAFGAEILVKLPCGRVLRREVDGGNGHSGHRSADVHFGLGELKSTVKDLPVTVRWRRRDGSLSKPVEMTLAFDRWHTIELGAAGEHAAAEQGAPVEQGATCGQEVSR